MNSFITDQEQFKDLFAAIKAALADETPAERAARLEMHYRESPRRRRPPAGYTYPTPAAARAATRHPHAAAALAETDLQRLAHAQRAKLIDFALSGKGDLLIATPPGAGKTHDAAAAAAAAAAQGIDTYWFAATHVKAQETIATLTAAIEEYRAANSPGTAPWREICPVAPVSFFAGRAADLDGKGPLCPAAADAHRVARAGLSAGLICNKAHGCKYQQQFIDFHWHTERTMTGAGDQCLAGHIFVLAHEYLYYRLAIGKHYKPGLMVIDEDIAAGAIARLSHDRIMILPPFSASRLPTALTAPLPAQDSGGNRLTWFHQDLTKFGIAGAEPATAYDQAVANLQPALDLVMRVVGQPDALQQIASGIADAADWTQQIERGRPKTPARKMFLAAELTQKLQLMIAENLVQGGHDLAPLEQLRLTTKARMLRQIAREMRDAPERPGLNSVWVSEDGKINLSYVRHMILGAKRRIFLDGTAEPALLNGVLYPDRPRHGKAKPRIAAWTMPVRRRAVVVQVADKTFSKTSLFRAGGSGEIEPKPLTVELMSFLAAIKERTTGRTAVFASKQVIEQLSLWGALPDDKFLTGHFGALRGLNEYEQCSQAIVIGREQPALSEIEGLGRAFWAGRAEGYPTLFGKVYQSQVLDSMRGRALVPLLTPAAAANRRKGSDMPAGSARVERHTDYITDLILKQIREAEILQAVERLRTVRQFAVIWVLTNIPLDEITPVRRAAWREIYYDHCDDQVIHDFYRAFGRMPATVAELQRSGLVVNKTTACNILRHHRALRAWAAVLADRAAESEDEHYFDRLPNAVLHGEASPTADPATAPKTAKIEEVLTESDALGFTGGENRCETRGKVASGGR